MTEIDSAPEYAVEVPGRGYADSHPYSVCLTKEPKAYSPVRDDAISALERTKERYIAMGCPEIAETVRLVSRTVTVTRGEWEPVMRKPL